MFDEAPLFCKYGWFWQNFVDKQFHNNIIFLMDVTSICYGSGFYLLSLCHLIKLLKLIIEELNQVVIYI